MSKTILVIDDDKSTCELMNDMLVDSGYRVTATTNPEDGIKKAYTEKPDLALVDTVMPDMDGFEVCRNIKAIKEKDIKVIIYTGFIEAVDAVRVRESGADDYCAKTEDFSNIVKTIQKHL